MQMRFYKLFSRLLFPKSYIAKFVLVALIGMHGPMTIAGLLMHASHAGAPPPPDGHGGPPHGILCSEFGPLVFIAAGTVFLSFALYALLQPIAACSQSLRDYMEHGILPQLPTGGKDEAGVLMSDLQKAIVNLDTLLKEQERLATRDSLTGLGNRIWSDTRLKQDILSARTTNRPACLAMIDLDYFKEANDRFGHEAGDQVLRQIGNILKREIRGEDWAARWGGDEFVVMLRNCDGPRAANVLERIRARVQNEVWAFAPNVRLNLSASIGYCVYNGDDEAEQLFLKADSALYAAKLDGRNCVTPFSPVQRLISEKLRIA